jgi:xanthine dehydrogenase YagS FAD-binding subunit
MEAFEYANPTTLPEALKLLGSNWSEAQVLAGGTDLISLMKDDTVSPKRLVNIKSIAALRGISKGPQGLRIGATATFDEIATSPLVRAEYPSILTAVLGVSSPQIRNMGTAGGDLCQRPRCWYFRNGFGLLALKDGKSLVPNGENRYHAILGGGPAYFVSASSLGPALVALGATVKLQSAAGTRTVGAAEFFVAPTDVNTREVDLKPEEILTEIVIPPAAGVRNATYEVRHREAIDWPLATASVALKMSGTKVASAMVVLGHVAPTPWLAVKAVETLRGQTITEATAEQAGAAAVEGAQPLSQNEYKVQLAKVAVKRALLAAAGKA